MPNVESNISGSTPPCAADVEAAEPNRQRHAVGVELGHVIRRHQQAARAGQCRYAVGWSHTLGGLERSEQLNEFVDSGGSLDPRVAVGIGRHRQVLELPHRREERAEARTGIGRFEYRETAVLLVLQVVGHRGASTSRRTIV
jgi:hypothetical protein